MFYDYYFIEKTTNMLCRTNSLWFIQSRVLYRTPVLLNVSQNRFIRRKYKTKRHLISYHYHCQDDEDARLIAKTIVMSCVAIILVMNSYPSSRLCISCGVRKAETAYGYCKSCDWD